MRLVHRTNYRGNGIVHTSNIDDEVTFDAIWGQAVRDDENPCCRRFGVRSVEIINSDLVEDHAGTWVLWRVR